MTEPSEPAKRHHVVIIGSGFGGLTAAKALKRADVDVTLISKTTTHLFQPLLYQVATGILSEGEIAPTTRLVLRKQKNVQVLLGEVEAHRPAANTRHLQADDDDHRDALRQPDRRRRCTAVLLRQRPVRDVRARHEDHRRRAGTPRPHPRRVRGRGGDHRSRRARTPADVRRGRRRPDRRRAGRPDRRARRPHAGRGVPHDQAERMPGDPARGRRARCCRRWAPKLGDEGAAPAGEDGRRGPAQRDGDQRRLQGRDGQGQGRRRAPHRMRLQGVVGGRSGQPAGQDDRRAVRRHRDRPRGPGDRGTGSQP